MRRKNNDKNKKLSRITKQNAHAHKRNQHLLSWYINSLSDGVDMAGSNSNDGYYEFTNTHSDSSNEEETTTTHTVDELDTHDRHYGIHYISDDSIEKRSDKGCDRQERGTDWMRKPFWIPAWMKNVCMYEMSINNLCMTWWMTYRSVID